MNIINIRKLFIPVIILLITGIYECSIAYADGDNPASEPIVRVYKDVDGDVFKYEGPLNGNEPHGHGIGIYTNGDKYVGEYKDGMKHGKGTYTWANGDKYVGEFRNGREHGQGTYAWADGNKYVGKFKENNPVGGWLYWPDGGKARSYKDSEGNLVYK